MRRFSGSRKLMAANYSIDDIRKYLNAIHSDICRKKAWYQATGLPENSFCMACYDGNYPVEYDPLLDKHIIERRRNRADGIAEALAKEELQIKLL
jgi:amidophosphoribosyltransferase